MAEEILESPPKEEGDDSVNKPDDVEVVTTVDFEETEALDDLDEEDDDDE
jgi:hypothetical protein